MTNAATDLVRLTPINLCGSAWTNKTCRRRAPGCQKCKHGNQKPPCRAQLTDTYKIYLIGCTESIPATVKTCIMKWYPPEWALCHWLLVHLWPWRVLSFHSSTGSTQSGANGIKKTLFVSHIFIYSWLAFADAHGLAARMDETGLD